jgi:putative ABC transport system ATP-binding protein
MDQHGDSPPDTKIIEVRDLYKCYWVGTMPYPALNGVDLTVEHGELVVIAGRSGSGKSTLLNVVGALEEADSGEVLVCGENIKTWDADQRAEFRLRHLGFVFQAYNLIRVLTARENVAYVCQLQGLPRPECLELADYWLEQVGIGYLGYRRPDQLSGGQQQRVAVARSLATGPELVLADEPTANVDSRTGRDLIALMRRLNRRFGTTFIISSHDPAVIDAAGRLVRIEDGRLVGPGLVYKPKRPYALRCPQRNRPWGERVRLTLRAWMRGGRDKGGGDRHGG